METSIYYVTVCDTRYCLVTQLFYFIDILSFCDTIFIFLVTLPRSRRQAETTTTPESVTLPVEDAPVAVAAPEVAAPEVAAPDAAAADAEAATTTVAPADEGEVLTVNHCSVPGFEFGKLVGYLWFETRRMLPSNMGTSMFENGNILVGKSNFF